MLGLRNYGEKGMLHFQGGVSSSCGSSSTCNALLGELQQIWIEIGETEADKDRMLLELEMECLQVYRRKVDEAANTKALLHQTVVAKEAELATLMAALGEVNTNTLISPDHKLFQSEKNINSLKEQLAVVTTLLEDLKQKRERRLKQFVDLKEQIDKLYVEVSGYGQIVDKMDSFNLEEQDISLRKLSEYQSHLNILQKEKSERLDKVLECVSEVHCLCGLLSLDFGKTVSDVHPSLSEKSFEQSTNVSDRTLEGLRQVIRRLDSERTDRFQKLKEVSLSLSKLWNLMGITEDEGTKFPIVNSISELSVSDITEPGVLSLDTYQQVVAEMERLNDLKAGKMKELVLKKRLELEDICYRTHIQPDPSTAADKANAMIDSGLVDPCELLENIEAQVNKAIDEALVRKEITDRIERWLSACDEENWLDDYNLDHNRYSAGKGVHINLKRAERARITVNRIPVMVDNLITKTLKWEEEKMKPFLYDGVRLVSILEDYKLTRQQKEEENKRARDQKKLSDMLLAKKEAIYGSKPSPIRNNSFRKINEHRSVGNGSLTPPPRRISMGTPTSELLTPRSYSCQRNGYHKEMRRLSTVPLNFVAMPKEEAMSISSACGSEQDSSSHG
ncbi:non-motor microtubule binding protein [Lithospermum erythrorhizon]|uniref:Non-motor microtubule binding protein n=1 Tax=Lithospermum erythrorhizon TaxID=34254 RepID=A0AAV3NV76_LITER